ncbi:MAG TPA: hypothetical protein VLX64_06315 [Thermoplasmata archaeon]|nr:hypothetical protein [Thermoplasmata archaeon]HUJ78604.1 hypothetical protein [Thermoplasmata archaeon]
MPLPPAPGVGPYALPLDRPSIAVLFALLGLFAVMLALLRRGHPKARRALEGYVEAAAVDIGFLVFALALVVGLALEFPHGNRTARGLYDVVADGYWLAFAIPIVTVGSSVHSRSRGGIPWLGPSLGIAAVLFGVFFAVYVANP